MHNNYCETHMVTFSECDYWGKVTARSYLCWFERVRFNISKLSGLSAFFHKEHCGSLYVNRKHNTIGENFIMPVLQSSLVFNKDLQIGDQINIHTWLDKPIGASCTFHHWVTKDGDNTIYVKGEVLVGLVGEKSGFNTALPTQIEVLLDKYIDEHFSGKKFKR